jgi:hypothetical protein
LLLDDVARIAYKWAEEGGFAELAEIADDPDRLLSLTALMRALTFEGVRLGDRDRVAPLLLQHLRSPVAVPVEAIRLALGAAHSNGEHRDLDS